MARSPEYSMHIDLKYTYGPPTQIGQNFLNLLEEHYQTHGRGPVSLEIQDELWARAGLPTSRTRTRSEHPQLDFGRWIQRI